jgi:hypothetical protein
MPLALRHVNRAVARVQINLAFDAVQAQTPVARFDVDVRVARNPHVERNCRARALIVAPLRLVELGDDVDGVARLLCAQADAAHGLFVARALDGGETHRRFVGRLDVD